MAEYIEREALLEKLAERDLCLCVSESDIKDIPAADVAPVVHGWWIDTEFYGPHHMTIVQCSACKNESEGSLDDAFCPMCGAKMDKKES